MTVFQHTLTAFLGANHDESCGSNSEYTLSERVEHLQKYLPPWQTVFGDSACYDPTAFFSSWQNFRLAFLPHNAGNFSAEQIVQPHGLNLAGTRHIQLGSFNTGSVRFSAFVFFPRGAKRSKSETSATKNALSLQRQRDFYDKIIIPAVYETVPDPSQQEIPQSYDIVYAKSRSFQEKPGNSRWQADDENRCFRLQYTITAENLPAFWDAVVRHANSLEIITTSGAAVKYFESPRLVFSRMF